MIKSNLTGELWIDTADGRVFAKIWNFDRDCEAGNEPVILFHDSLGCVELWRDFPVKLARETGRAIIAYDRCQMERLQRYHGDKAEWVFSSWTETWLSKDFSSWKLDEDLRNVHCPVLVLHGDNDEYGSIEHARRIESLTHGPAILKVLSHCGHVPHRETQPIVMDAISEFLRQKTG